MKGPATSAIDVSNRKENPRNPLAVGWYFQSSESSCERRVRDSSNHRIRSGHLPRCEERRCGWEHEFDQGFKQFARFGQRPCLYD